MEKESFAFLAFVCARTTAARRIHPRKILATPISSACHVMKSISSTTRVNDVVEQISRYRWGLCDRI